MYWIHGRAVERRLDEAGPSRYGGRPMSATSPRAPWARTRILTHLLASTAGQVLLIYPGEHLVGAALLALNGAYFVLFFRNVAMTGRLEQVLRESGDLPEDFDEQDDSVALGTTYPWIWLTFPVLYLGAVFDGELAWFVGYAVWFDLVRLVLQFLLVAVVHATLRHKLRMLTDPDYLATVVQRHRDHAASKRGDDSR
jgi:hypothetical protein